MPRKPRIDYDLPSDPEDFDDMNCEDFCDAGAGCPCYEQGVDFGSATTALEIEEEHDQMLLDSVYVEIERLFDKSLKPLDDRHILQGDESGVPEAKRLRDLKKKVLEALR